MTKGQKGKGGKNRRRGKNEGDTKRELVFKEDGQEYAQVRICIVLNKTFTYERPFLVVGFGCGKRKQVEKIKKRNRNRSYLEKFSLYCFFFFHFLWREVKGRCALFSCFFFLSSL